MGNLCRGQPVSEATCVGATCVGATCVGATLCVGATCVGATLVVAHRGDPGIPTGETPDGQAPTQEQFDPIGVGLFEFNGLV